LCSPGIASQVREPGSPFGSQTKRSSIRCDILSQFALDCHHIGYTYPGGLLFQVRQHRAGFRRRSYPKLYLRPGARCSGNRKCPILLKKYEEPKKRNLK
jgi:hypothetical protein